MKAFQSKLKLFAKQLNEENFVHFPVENTSCYTSIIRQVPVSVDALKEEFIRFADFKVIEGQFDLLSSPFSCDIETATEELQMELIDLQADNSLRGCLKVNQWSSFFYLCTQKSFKI